MLENLRERREGYKATSRIDAAEALAFDLATRLALSQAAVGALTGADRPVGHAQFKRRW